MKECVLCHRQFHWKDYNWDYISEGTNVCPKCQPRLGVEEKKE